MRGVIGEDFTNEHPSIPSGVIDVEHFSVRGLRGRQSGCRCGLRDQDADRGG